MTVAGQCIGAGNPDEARANTKKLTIWSAVVLLAANWLIFALTFPVTRLAGLDAAAAHLYVYLLVISIVKPFLWPLAFTPSNGMRAAGDVKVRHDRLLHLHVGVPGGADHGAVPVFGRGADRHLVRVFRGLVRALHRVHPALPQREVAGAQGHRPLKRPRVKLHAPRAHEVFAHEGRPGPRAFDFMAVPQKAAHGQVCYAFA